MDVKTKENDEKGSNRAGWGKGFGHNKQSIL